MSTLGRRAPRRWPPTPRRNLPHSDTGRSRSQWHSVHAVLPPVDVVAFVHGVPTPASLRRKWKYAPTQSELITTAIAFQAITGRERMSKP